MSKETSRVYNNKLVVRSRPTVFVGMSGGVDSSVSALLLKNQGYKVVGIYMKNWSQDLPGMKCPWADDLADAKRVAVKLGIDFEVWDFEDAYRKKVVEYMLNEFKKGNTPNPDIMCNQEIKFKLFYEKAVESGADFIATGHYARVKNQLADLTNPISSLAKFEPSSFSATRSSIAGLPQLLRAVDEKKDQTYFLYRISNEALAHTIFPIGEMIKADVKKIAKESGLHNAYKKESMGVCFVGEVGMKDFLREYIDIQPGEIQEIESGRTIGRHDGAVFYTIGQRHGLYISGIKGEVNSGLPYYVVKKDLEKNILFVSRNLNNSEIWTDELKLTDVLIRTLEGAYRPASNTKPCPESLDKPCFVRLRHLGKLIPAELKNNTLYFKDKIKRPAAGQSAVFYDQDICLGGGIII